MSIKATLEISELKFDTNGLIPVIVQDHRDGTILMVAYMNKESLQMTFESGVMVYWSRSRQKFWKKGESSGNIQNVKAIHRDCDSDALLAKVEQIGEAACHTGQRSCFYRQAKPDGGWEEISEPVFDPAKVYKNNK